MQRIRKAHDFEKRQWSEAGELYTLYGYVKVSAVLQGYKTSYLCPVEYLGEGRDCPNYEIHAPDGMHFDCGLHTILGVTQADLLDRVGTLVECGEHC